jgi:hypothetical protein
MKRAALSLAFFAATSASVTARADLLPEGMHYVPIELTLDGQDAVKDATIVVQGCNEKGGRHAFTIAKPGELLECHAVKRPLEVRAVPKKDMKPVEDLYAKNLGWGAELGEAEKLLAKAPSCGKAELNGLVETSKNIDHLVAKYQIEKTAAGCSLKKIGDLAPVVKDGVATAAPSGSAPADKESPKSAPSSSAAATPSSAGSPAASTGGCSRCSIDPVATNGLAAFLTAAAFAAGLVGRRKRR